MVDGTPQVVRYHLQQEPARLTPARSYLARFSRLFKSEMKLLRVLGFYYCNLTGIELNGLVRRQRKSE